MKGISRKHVSGKLKISRKKAVIGVAVILAAAIIFIIYGKKGKAADAKAQVSNTATVERQNIVSQLSASGSLEAKDSYNVTSLVEGEVISADFEEGDQVTKDQVLYQLDSSSMESEVKSAGNSLVRAQEDYEEALADYQEAVEKFSGNTYKSTETGYIKTLYIKNGDKVSGQTKIADIYNDKIMKLKVPFLSEEAVMIPQGGQVTVTLTDTGETIFGTVTSVANMDETVTGGRVVRYVYVQVDNPGGLTTSHTATVAYNGINCVEEGNFEASTETEMTGEDLDTTVEIQNLLVAEGDYINEGTALFQMTSNTADKLMRSYKNSMDQAQEQVETAENKVETTQDTYDNYTITAPISGKVIAKNVKEGEKISRNSSSDTTLAVIYDLSALTFEMSIDELDIQKVKTGQKVQITADAFEGETFTGTVTNVSLEGSYSNGVTNYPVTVTLDDAGDLLPGMNVDGTIILEQADNVLAIPVDALMRGNKVYVKDDGTATEEEKRGVPDGFRAVEVETGITSDSWVEIISGLSEGDQVYVDQSSKNSESTFMMMTPNMGGPGGGGGNSGGARQGGPGGGR